MNLFLDEDIASALLTRLLRRAGHDVQVPADVNLGGEPDPVVLRHAFRMGRVLLCATTATSRTCTCSLLKPAAAIPVFSSNGLTTIPTTA